MAWQDYADKHINTPVVFVTIDFNSGMRYYSNDYIRLAAGTIYKAKILNLPQIRHSIGDIKRTYERNRIVLLLGDSDYEFRTLEETETVGFKNREVVIKIAFQDDNYATSLTLFTGQIYDWHRLDNLQYEFYVEEISSNLDNSYPWKRVEITDYTNADGSAVGWTVPIPYGEISALGLSGDGAYGHPSLTLQTGLPLIDNTTDSEKHLVGLQTAAITVDRVYLNGTLKTEGGGNDYTISTQVIDGFTHTEIHWNASINPGETDRVSCDITFGSREPVEAIYHFLTSFCGHSSGDFNAASKAAAEAKEEERGYSFAGALWEARALRDILDDWRNELELDIYWNKDGEICFKYLSADISPTPNHYQDYLHILDGFDSDPKVSELLNYLKYGYNYHYSKTYYYNYALRQNTDSQTKHGRIFKDFMGFQWIRSASMALDIAARKILRFKDPVVFDVMPFPLKTFGDDLADIIKITHFEGRGTSGYSEQHFQIREVDYSLNNFVNTMMLEDASSFIAGGFILGDLSIPATWTAASGGERDYGYLCGADGLFSDGQPGKYLLD